MATPAQWLEGARLRTLPLAVAPVLIGCGAALGAVGGFSEQVIGSLGVESDHPEISLWGYLLRALLALIVSLGLQIGSNFANDYSDGVRGTDDVRVGPLRLTASGAAPWAMAMAAAAIVELLGGTPRAAVHAASLALMNTIGLVCDPVGGYVEVPCVSRNAFFAVHAVSAAQLALAQLESFIPPDEVLGAMASVGRMMPAALRETAEGGLAQTPTGLAVTARMEGRDDQHSEEGDLPGGMIELPMV